LLFDLDPLGRWSTMPSGSVPTRDMTTVSPGWHYLLRSDVDLVHLLAPALAMADAKEVHTVARSSTVVAISPDDRYVAVAGSDNAVHVLDSFADWKDVAQLPHDQRVQSTAFSPDGTLFASGSMDNIAQVWAVTDNWRKLMPLPHAAAVTQVFFSPDNRYLATRDASNITHVWSIKDNWLEVARTTTAADGFSPDGHFLVRPLANPGQSAVPAASLLWQPHDLVTQVCARLLRNLTQAEWTQYLSDAPYRKICPDLP
jgi:WD40 repeat protein